MNTLKNKHNITGNIIRKKSRRTHTHTNPRTLIESSNIVHVSNEHAGTNSDCTLNTAANSQSSLPLPINFSTLSVQASSRSDRPFEINLSLVYLSVVYICPFQTN